MNSLILNLHFIYCKNPSLYFDKCSYVFFFKRVSACPLVKSGSI